MPEQSKAEYFDPTFTQIFEYETLYISKKEPHGFFAGDSAIGPSDFVGRASVTEGDAWPHPSGRVDDGRGLRFAGCLDVNAQQARELQPQPNSQGLGCFDYNWPLSIDSSSNVLGGATGWGSAGVDVQLFNGLGFVVRFGHGPAREINNGRALDARAASGICRL